MARLGWYLATIDLGSVSRHAQDSRGTGTYAGYLLAALGFVAVVWLLLFLWDRYRHEWRGEADHPRTLFLELCRVHGLSRNDRALLWHAAVQYRLDHPALVFAIPHFLQQLAAAPGPDHRAYAGLALRLFGSQSTEGPAADTPAPAETGDETGGETTLTSSPAANSCESL